MLSSFAAISSAVTSSLPVPANDYDFVPKRNLIPKGCHVNQTHVHGDSTHLGAAHAPDQEVNLVG